MTNYLFAQPKKFDLSQLRWLSGTWKGDMFGGQGIEYWSDPAGGTIMNMLRITANDSTQVIEFKIIEQQNDDIILRFKHFSSHYESKEKDQSLSFRLVEITDENYVFESDRQTSPKRITYCNIGSKIMKVRVDILTTDGKIQFFETTKKKITGP